MVTLGRISGIVAVVKRWVGERVVVLNNRMQIYVCEKAHD